MTAAAAPPRPVQVNPDEPVLVIDLRPPAAQDRDASRARFANELDGVYGLRTQRADGLDAALAGDDTGDLARAQADLAAARTAYGALDCAHAAPAADRAALGFAARQAAGLPDDAGARAAWAYVLLCADAGGDRDAAARAAAHLRVLGAMTGDTVGIPAATWDRYPDIDAHVGRDLVELTVRSPDGDADVWIDLVRVGPAPATAVVPAGAHVVAVGAAAPATRRAAVRVTATKSTAIDVALVDEGTPLDDVAAKVRAWRATPPTGLEMTAILDRLHARVALVLVGQGAVATWVKGPHDTQARQVADGALDEPLPIGALINARIAAWGGRGEEPDVPRLRDHHEQDDTRPGRDHWWVYASLVGAVAIGAAVVYAHDTARDHQRIELVFP